ncbi:MAG: hypothetical protein H6581_21740 [Bacteroidia bacterium]|nr:hypothetical protein [Bacteroidia bacterium]
MLRIQLTLFLLLAAFWGWGQAIAPEQLALDFAREGLKYADEGQDEEALKSLRIAAKLDPGKAEYVHYIAQILFGQKKYEEVMTTVFPLIKNSQATSKTYQLYGNSLDMLGATDRAVLVYKEGLRKFDHPGPLYMELGVVEFARENDELARQYWEEGIKKDPQSAGNYYWAAKSYAETPELIRTMVYGELFLNLERSGERTREISRLLYEVYAGSLVGLADSSVAFGCSVHSPDSLSGYDFRQVKKFDFTQAFTFSWIFRNRLPEQGFSLAEFHQLRKVFLENWFDWFANRIKLDCFQWLRQLMGTEGLEAYHYWLLFDGSPAEFQDWYSKNQESYDRFEDWFIRNPMPFYGKKPFFPREFD